MQQARLVKARRRIRIRIRLPRDAYAFPGPPFSITVCTSARRPVFADSSLADSCAAAIQSLAERTGVGLHAFCVMPDHLHLLIQSSGDCDVTSFVARLKSFVQHRFRDREIHGALWQRSFWDHAIRGDEDLTAAARYIVNNPVRAGLVEVAEEYPWSWMRWS